MDLSRDGLTVASGAIAFGEVSNQVGYVKVSRFNETTKAWETLGEPIKGDFLGTNFGTSVNLSDDGNTVVIGVPLSNVDLFNSGEVRVYRYNGQNWDRLGDVKRGRNVGDEFGTFSFYTTSFCVHGNHCAGIQVLTMYCMRNRYKSCYQWRWNTHCCWCRSISK
jgi:hypothetical protein